MSLWWLKSLDKPDRFLIGTVIKTVEYGWPIGMPVGRPVGNGLYEVRTKLPGNRIVRVIFYIARDQMILLNADKSDAVFSGPNLLSI